MTTQTLQPLPRPEISLVANDKTTLPWTQYLAQLDAIIRLLNSNTIAPLIGVAAPSNANAAAAGVVIGQLYRGTADPAIVYIRTA